MVRYTRWRNTRLNAEEQAEIARRMKLAFESVGIEVEEPHGQRGQIRFHEPSWPQIVFILAAKGYRLRIKDEVHEP